MRVRVSLPRCDSWHPRHSNAHGKQCLLTLYLLAFEVLSVRIIMGSPNYVVTYKLLQMFTLHTLIVQPLVLSQRRHR